MKARLELALAESDSDGILRIGVVYDHVREAYRVWSAWAIERLNQLHLAALSMENLINVQNLQMKAKDEEIARLRVDKDSLIRYKDRLFAAVHEEPAINAEFHTDVARRNQALAASIVPGERLARLEAENQALAASIVPGERQARLEAENRALAESFVPGERQARLEAENRALAESFVPGERQARLEAANRALAESFVPGERQARLEAEDRFAQQATSKPVDEDMIDWSDRELEPHAPIEQE